MKTKFLTIFLTLFLLNCDENGNFKTNQSLIDDTYSQTLVEQPMGGSDLYISIPTDYTINATEDVDFSVYYIVPSDTSKKADFYAGVYLGNHPTRIEQEDSCTINEVKSKFLGKNEKWRIEECNESYWVQTITNYKQHKGWDRRLHVFGRANSEFSKNKLFTIFSTIKKKE